MIIDIITIFPEIFDNFLNTSIVKRAINQKKLKVNLHNLRDYSKNKHKKIDDIPYGGGEGMLISFPPVYDCIKKLKKKNSIVIYLSPQGKLLKQDTLINLSSYDHIIILCGRYEGIDARILNIIDYELSIGDYILTGGEIPAMVIIDSLTRLIPGVINETSVKNDTFSNNNLLKYPEYTIPREYKGYKVPDVLTSGHHENIKNWRMKNQLLNTINKRPDLLKKNKLTTKQKEILNEIINKK